MDSFMERRMDECFLVYPEFVSTLTQRPKVQRILPIAPAGDAPAKSIDYIFEPDPRSILEELLPRYVEVLIYEAILEMQASEQSARMVAMRNANQNAQDLIKDLTLVYNKTRQAAITREVTEIASAAEFMASQNRSAVGGRLLAVRPTSLCLPPTLRRRRQWQRARSSRSSGRWWTSSSHRSSFRTSTTPSRSRSSARAASAERRRSSPRSSSI
jgi:hypothetical protein